MQDIIVKSVRPCRLGSVFFPENDNYVIDTAENNNVIFIWQTVQKRRKSYDTGWSILTGIASDNSLASNVDLELA